jgi:hypothetical protein
MEANLIHRAIDNLYAASGIVGEVQQVDATDVTGTSFDGVLRLLHTSHAVEVPFVVKRQLTTEQVSWLRSLDRKALIVFEKGSDAVKEQLRKDDLSYLETSGNAFLSLDDFFLFINTLKGTVHSAGKGSKAFTKTGLKIIYSLLSNSYAAEMNYRSLAELSGTSIDSVGRVLNELLADRYLVKTGLRGFKILDQPRLLKDWAPLFNKTLRPKLKTRVFDFQDSNLEVRNLLHQDTAPFIDTNGLLGGELAAELMGKQLIARKATVYVTGSFVDFALNNNLKPAKNGRITLIEKFWNKSDNYFENTESLVSPTLVYADLLNDPSPRNLEAADHILNRNFHESV